MIKGKGLIATSMKSIDKESILLYASGVPNSLETLESEFLREKNLIEKSILENPEKLFIYFSTCSIYDSSKNNSPYVLHKLKMEQLIAEKCEKYFILRISNAVGNGGNANLLLNYLVRTIENKTKITVHTKASRNLIDVEDIAKVTHEIIEDFENNQIVNIAYLQNYTIIEITEKISKVLNIEPFLHLVNEGSGYQIETSKIENYFKKNKLTDEEQYLKNLILKYYTPKICQKST